MLLSESVLLSANRHAVYSLSTTGKEVTSFIRGSRRFKNLRFGQTISFWDNAGKVYEEIQKVSGDPSYEFALDALGDAVTITELGEGVI